MRSLETDSIQGGRTLFGPPYSMSLEAGEHWAGSPLSLVWKGPKMPAPLSSCQLSGPQSDCSTFSPSRAFLWLSRIILVLSAFSSTLLWSAFVSLYHDTGRTEFLTWYLWKPYFQVRPRSQLPEDRTSVRLQGVGTKLNPQKWSLRNFKVNMTNWNSDIPHWKYPPQTFSSYMMSSLPTSSPGQKSGNHFWVLSFSHIA